jgi:expansin (peptidoglycan-binding protein)
LYLLVLAGCGSTAAPSGTSGSSGSGGAAQASASTASPSGSGAAGAISMANGASGTRASGGSGGTNAQPSSAGMSAQSGSGGGNAQLGGAGGNAQVAGASAGAGVSGGGAAGMMPVGMPMDSGPMQCGTQAEHKGGLTWYTPPSAMGNCGIPWGMAGNLYGAMATADYMNSTVCGMCAEITGPSGMKATIQVIDQCPIGSNPKCTAGHIDLSHAAFNAVVPSNNAAGGEVPNNTPVSWRYVPCPVTTPIVYHFKDGTSGNWLAVQIRNTRYGIAGIKWRKSGSAEWKSMTPRTNDLAYFIADMPGGATTYDFQVSDVNGQTLEDWGVALKVNGDTNGHAQFPDCKK